MVNPIKALARSTVGHGMSGFSSQEIHAGLANMRQCISENDPAYWIALSRWCGDDRYRHNLELTIYKQLKRIAAGHNWRKLENERICLLAKLAVQEVISPPVCRSCAGTGQSFKRVTKEPEHEGGVAITRIESIDCPTCAGKGHLAMRRIDRADHAGIAHSNWNRIWEDRYTKYILPIPRNYLHKAYFHLKNSLEH